MTLEPLPLEKHDPRDPHLILVRRDMYLLILVFWQLLEFFKGKGGNGLIFP